MCCLLPLMEGQAWQRIDFDIRFSIRDQAEILRTWMLYFSQVVLYVPRMEDKLETCPVEIGVMNATCNDTLFEIVGLMGSEPIAVRSSL